MRFEHLLKPLDLGFTQLKNRCLMGSMHTMLEEMHGGHEKAAAFYAERARGQVALIVTGGISPNADGVVFAGGARLDEESQVHGHRLITKAVHNEVEKFVCKFFIPDDMLIIKIVLHLPLSRPRSIMYTPRALNHEEVLQTIDDFVNCAAFGSAGRL